MSFQTLFVVTTVTTSIIYSEDDLLLGSEHNSDSEVADLINPHWKTFPKPSAKLSVTFGVICFVLGILGMTGNASVIYFFSRNKRLHNPSSSLIVNLAISDFCMMAILSPMYFSNSICRQWIFGKNSCRFYGFIGALFGTASIMTMAGIALDRYFAICKPFTTNRYFTKGCRAKIIIVFVWTYSIGWATPPLLGINNYVLDGFLTSCSFDYLDSSVISRLFILAMCIGAYFTPLSLIATAYSGITWKVHVHSKRFRILLTPISQTDSRFFSRMKSEVNTAKTGFIIVICWTIAWTPYAVVALLGIMSYTSALTPLVAQLPAVFAKTAAVYNPFVYALSHRKYRGAIRSGLMTLIGQSRGQSEIMSSSNSSFRSRQPHITAASRSHQRKSRLSIKYSIQRESLQMHSRLPCVATASLLSR